MSALSSHILIVDDQDPIRNLVKFHLKDIGHVGSTSDCENITIAQGLLKESSMSDNPIKFIICDWNMPGGNGIELLRWVRKTPAFSQIPFLILTTENEQAKILEALEAGVSNFLLKPWQKEDLLGKMNACWDKHSS